VSVGPVARNGALSLVALVLIGGTRIVYGLLISRATDLETFGLIGVLIAVTMISSYLLPSGLGSATSRYVPYQLGQGDAASARGHYRLLGRGALLASIGLAAIAGLGVYLVLAVPSMVALQVALLTLVYSLYTTDKAALYAFGRVGRYVSIELAGSAIVVATAIAVVISGSTLYLAPFIVGYGFFVVGARIAIQRELRGDVAATTSPERRSMLRYALIASVGIVASAGFLQATQLLAARFAIPSEVAFFAAAVTLVAPMYFLPRALSLALFPFMSEAHGAGRVEVVRRHTDVATRAILAILAPVFVLSVLLAPEAMFIFGGPAYVAGAHVLRLILVAAFLSIIGVASVNALSSDSTSQLTTTVKWSVTGCVTGLIVVSVLGGPLGAVGVGLAYLFGTAITATGPIAVVWRRYEMAWAGPVARGVLTVLAAAVIAELVESMGAGGVQPWPIHVALAVVGVGISLLVLRRDIIAVLAQSLRRTSGPAGSGRSSTGGSVADAPLRAGREP
jgi:O-antigen/teichoic acid export membrane protein